MRCGHCRIGATRGSVINESFVFVSYHNIDLAYAFQLATLLLRYYRKVWLDRFEVEPTADWQKEIRDARARATGVIAIVSDDYLQSANCRAEFEYFRERGIAVTAVIARNFSTEVISDYTFSDWVDFRRWFDDPSDLSVENLLSQIPQSEAVPKTGERLDYLRQYIQETELALTRMPTSWAALRNSEAPGASDIRPRSYHAGLLHDWEFAGLKSGIAFPFSDLSTWSKDETQFIVEGETGSGKTFFARLLTLAQAHIALRDELAATPIWFDMARWDDSTRSLDAFIEANWPLLSYWQHWFQSQQALVVLDNWCDFAGAYPGHAADVAKWVDASPNQRFVMLSRHPHGAFPTMPTVKIGRLSAPLAQKFAAGSLTLEQQNSFRQLLRQKSALIENSPLAYLCIGLELLSADRALAYNQWQSNPLPALIRLRSQQISARMPGLNPDMILTALQGLAWTMMLRDKHRFFARADTDRQVSDARVIDFALDIGLLVESGTLLRFESELIQWYLAAENLKKDGLVKYLTRPDFGAAQGRKASKWDSITLLVVDSVGEQNRQRIIDQIAEIDPFLAGICLRRHPAVYASYQEIFVRKLVYLCGQNAAAQGAFRGAIADLPEPDKTADLLIGLLSELNNKLQLWLWYEISALPLEIPVGFIERVAGVDRGATVSAADQLSAYSLSRSIAYLVKLSQQQDEELRRNAIWLLGELKYLPSAILLLDYLEKAERDDLDEVLLALMKYAYSEILARVLRWSQDNAAHRASVIMALSARKRWVTSRLLAFADARRLTLNPEFYDIAVNSDERDIAIGLAQIAAKHVDLPEEVDTAVLAAGEAAALHQLIAGAIKHLPNREGFQQLVDDIANVVSDPPEATVIAGSNVDALLYGGSVFDKISAQAEPKAVGSLPADLAMRLRHSDWQQRHRGVNSLAGLPAGESLPLLLEATADDDKRVRLAAYEILCKFDGEIAAQKALVAALSDPDSETVTAMTELLRGAELDEYDVFYDLLDSANPTAVAAAITILGDSRNAVAASELSQLRNDMRIPAQGGGTIGQRAREAIDRLEASVTGGDSTPADVSGTIEGARSKYSDKEKILRTLQVLRDDDWGRTQKAAKFLRKFARHMRGRDNGEIRRLLCETLSDGNWSVRWAAAEALAVLHDRAAIAALSACLTDSSWIVQVAAIRALVELQAVESAAQLVPLLQRSHKQVREATAEALGEMRETLAIEPLAAALEHEQDDFVRLAALKSLCQISVTDARPWLELALSDSFAHIRHFALQQLSPFMDESDIPILRQLLEDGEKPSWEGESLRDLAIQTLRRIDSVESRSLLDSLHAAEDWTGA